MLKPCRLALYLLIYLSLTTPTFAASAPTNIILLIGDGMGPEQVKAAGYYNGAPLSFEGLPYQGMVTTYPAGGGVTDSAAAATAIATGHKVYNGVISIASPGDGLELQTLLEYSRDLGKRTGLVTTTTITHATPAGFGAHEPSRNNTSNIAADMLNQTRPNVIFGGGANGISVLDAQNAGYTVVTDRAQMQALNADCVTRVSGQFGATHLPYEYDGLGSLPHLSEMTATALDILDADPDGFFLMVEGGRIDHAGHANDIRRNVFETLEFSDTVQVVLDWAAGRDDTLVIVTADHETGGLSVTDNGAGNFPVATWTTTDHTGANVPVYAWGVNADLVPALMNNTDFFEIVTVVGPAGNANADAKVDSSDLAIWQQNYDPVGAVGLAFAEGDWNFDDKIDSADLALWQQNYDPVGTGGIPVTAIPEPATMMLMVGGLVILGRRRPSRW